LLVQRDERAVLQRLDRSLGLAEDRGRLAVREAEHELQRQHLLLLAREVVDEGEHRLLPDRVERARLRGGRLVGLRLRHLFLRLPAAGNAVELRSWSFFAADKAGSQRRATPTRMSGLTGDSLSEMGSLLPRSTP